MFYNTSKSVATLFILLILATLKANIKNFLIIHIKVMKL